MRQLRKRRLRYAKRKRIDLVDIFDLLVGDKNRHRGFLVRSLTKYYREEWEANKRIVELGMTRVGLNQVRRVARDAQLRTNQFFPANAAGTFSYQYGSWGLRDQFVGKDWKVDRPGGVEAICNDALKVRVAFCNVDVACDDVHAPKPRTDKGAGAERAAQMMFPGMPAFGSMSAPEWTLYYLMLDLNGFAELSLPAIQKGKFVDFVERIYLYEGDDDSTETLPISDEGIADGFDPVVARKK